jgi:hypothetical protein
MNTGTLDPQRLSLRSATSSASRVDAAAGTISRVSLITGDREAGGHGLWIDRKSLETFQALLTDRRLKAYATHGTWSKDGTLDEIGYWQASALEGNQLFADFVALTSWKTHARPEYDTLFELAEKLPSEFGVSLSFKFATVWVMPGGAEIATRRKFSAIGDAVYDPPAPVGALRALPSVRAVEIYSADFVDQPAANAGLFRSESGGAIEPSSREAEIARLSAERDALPHDASAALRRGEIIARLKVLRSDAADSGIVGSPAQIEKLRGELAAVKGTDEESALKRGKLCAQIQRLRSQQC